MDNELYYYESLLDSENIALDIYEYNGDKDALWKVFAPHHYLSAELNKASKMFVCYWGDILVAVDCMLPMPSGSAKHGFRGHRLVVLPDYQSLGIGTKFSTFIFEYYLSKGMKVYARSTHLRIRDYWENSPYYIATSHNNKKCDLNKNFSNENYKERICGSYEYMGKDYIKPHIDIHIDYNEDMDTEIIKSDLAYLKSKGYYLTVITGDVKSDNPIDLLCQELGIRTQLLYYRGKISGTYKNKKILTSWTREFSNKVRRRY